MTPRQEERREKRLDFATKWLVISVVVLAIGAYGALIFGFLTRGDTNELSSQGDQQACMSQFNGLKEKAANELEKINDRRDDLYDDAQAAIAVGDTAKVDAILKLKPGLRIDQKLARDDRDDANEKYLDMSFLRGTDPEAFLKVCAKMPKP